MMKALSNDPKHHLSTNIHNLINSQSEEARKLLIHQIIQEEKTGGNEDIQSLLSKHPPLVEFLMRMHEMEVYEDFFSPKKLVECRRVVWGVRNFSESLVHLFFSFIQNMQFLKPILDGNWLQLLYLCSLVQLPGQFNNSVSTSEELHQHAITTFLQETPSFSADVASWITKLSEDCFLKYLAPISSHWGLNTEEYRTGHNLYWKGLIEGVETRELDTLSSSETWTEEQHSILRELPKKMMLIRSVRPFHGSLGIPPGLEETVILCPSYCQAMMDIFSNMSQDLELVCGC